MLVVLDTNLLVSAFILQRGVPHDILIAWREDAFRVVTTELVYDELVDVLRRPKIARSYAATSRETSDFLAFVRSRSRFAVPVSPIEFAVRDPDDAVLLRLAVGSNADYLVTGDNDLLTLAGDAALGALRIVTPRDFLRLLHALGEEGPA